MLIIFGGNLFSLIVALFKERTKKPLLENFADVFDNLVIKLKVGDLLMEKPGN
jgi:hypothetical protein